jgi:hypothetical protein
MWINETVCACVQAYNYGIASPMWWGSGLAFKIALMAVMGILTKLRVPHAHISLGRTAFPSPSFFYFQH